MHYISSCKKFGVKSHPARFPGKLPEFFIKMLTKPGDVVMALFSGPNTTGEVAERLGRRWISCDMDKQYVAASAFRFLPRRMALTGQVEGEHPCHQILNGETADLRQYAVLSLPPVAIKPLKAKPKVPVIAGLFD